MKARLAIYGRRGVTLAGYLPTIGLEFSEEIGGSGSITYQALMSDVDSLDAWDCTAVVQLETAPGVWTAGPAYGIRHEYTHKAGFRTFQFTAPSLLEQWGREAVVLPEYVKGAMPRRAGRERGIGWMSSAYGPLHDPNEAWDACYEPGRSTMPPDWPSGSGAEWISASGATSETEAKFFRAGLTISGSKRLVEFYLSSDEPATLWVGGEQIISTDVPPEAGKKEMFKQQMVLYPGEYAVAVYTATHFSKGGDGVDPILCAAAIIDSEGDPSSWILASGGDWLACRRNNDPPNDVPPGPTPGQVLHYLRNEAAERRCSGWENVNIGFSDTHDSYGLPWTDSTDVAERMFTYGSDTYFDVFSAFAEADEFDTWLGPGLILHAAPRQGQHRAIVLTETHLHEFHTRGTPGAGSWCAALARDGWFYEQLDGYIRREYSLELGTAITRVVGRRIAKASLRDRWRWDASGSLNPPQTGWIPYVDLKLGDWMSVDYQAVSHNLSITSFSASAGEGGLLWDVEFTEYPNDTTAPGAITGSTGRQPTGGLFEGLSA